MYVPETCTQRFAAVSVSTVVGFLVLVVVPAVAKLVVQFRVQSVLHKFRDRFLEQILDVIHAADVCQLQ